MSGPFLCRAESRDLLVPWGRSDILLEYPVLSCFNMLLFTFFGLFYLFTHSTRGDLVLWGKGILTLLEQVQLRWLGECCSFAYLSTSWVLLRSRKTHFRTTQNRLQNTSNIRSIQHSLQVLPESSRLPSSPWPEHRHPWSRCRSQHQACRDPHARVGSFALFGMGLFTEHDISSEPQGLFLVTIN